MSGDDVYTSGTDRVWVVSRTPQRRNTPTPSSVFSEEETARKQARAYQRNGWNVRVDSFRVLSKMTAAAKGMTRTQQTGEARSGGDE
jgi:hypothetical protein